MSEEKKLAQEVLNAKVRDFESLISECEQICDKHKLSFSVETTYGAGASYYADEVNDIDGSSWFASSQSY